MIAAICSPCAASAARTASRSLYGSTIVSAAAPSVTPGVPGMPSVSEAGAGGHEQRVGVAVVVAVELDELVAPGEAAREPDRAHRRLGARGDHAHHLDGRARPRTTASAMRDLDLGRRAEARAACSSCSRTASSTDVGRMAEDHRAPRRHEVDVLVAVDVPHAASPSRGRRRSGRARRDLNARTGEFTPPGMTLLRFREQSGWIANAAWTTPLRRSTVIDDLLELAHRVEQTRLVAGRPPHGCARVTSMHSSRLRPWIIV